ncbi:hypothetical protein [Desulfosporosinus sp. FKA]|uniref:SHOCT domain-containing protein n=1 Tax=Desulfosporosinus sp. FKA TaxID=1969834 RepID=UPI000B4A222C|nr:hypothetical protein [Desulfosporosinus sp. FKA]
MNPYSGGFSFGSGQGHISPIPNAPGSNFSVPNSGGSNVINNGLNVYALINMGLHFIIVIAVLLLIFYTVKHLGKFLLSVNKQSDKALELLNERYARGEIDTDDYMIRKRTLGYMSETKTG